MKVLKVILSPMPKPDLPALRLANQQLSRPKFSQPVELVSFMGAVQAQDYAGAKWSLGVRLPGSTDRSIEQALANKTFLRTWALRGTLEFVAAADIRWIVSLVGSRVIASIQGRYRQLELDESTLQRCNELILKALRQDPELNRTTLLAMLEQNGISTQGMRAPHILQRASLEGLVCQTVAIKNNPTYILLDSLVPQPKLLPREEAIAELAKRYFASRGPATLKDFAWWLGLPLAEAKTGLEAAQNNLIHEKIDGQVYWFPESDAYNGYTQGVFLLQEYDEYLLGYQDRSAVAGAKSMQMISRSNGFNPYILKNGQVAGTWRRTTSKKEVQMNIYAPEFSQAEMDELQAAARRYGEFLEMPVKIS